MAQTNYLYNKTLEYLIGNRNFTNAPVFYVALSFNTSGSTVSEPSGNGYSRVAVDNNSTNWSTNVDGVVSNISDISFEESTGAWGAESIKSIAIYDALTNGNLLYTGPLPLDLQKIVQKASAVIIPTASIKFGKVTE